MQQQRRQQQHGWPELSQCESGVLAAAGVRNRRLSHIFPTEPRQDTAVLKSDHAGCWDLFFRPRMPTPYMSVQLVEEA